MTRALLAAAGLFALLAVGCASETPIASLTVSSSAVENAFTADVYDHAGLIASVEPLPEDQLHVMDEGVVVSPDGLTVDVHWTGGVKHREHPVVLARDGSSYVIDINVDGGGGIDSWISPSTSAAYLLGLRLHLSSPITQDAVRLHVHGILG